MTPSASRLPRRPPLPLTSLAILLLLSVPAWWLSRWPRPKAQGLEQLMAAASLLQSFPATPERRLPALWRERLGEELGSRLWRLQRRGWWQFWGPHADGAPYLAIPDPASSLTSLVGGSPASRALIEQHALRVGNLLVLAPDPLARRLLRDALLPRQRAARGLRRQCVQRLESGQAVFWNPTALGAMLGPIAPLFQRYQEGCLSLSLAADNRLLWQGQTSAVDGLQAAPPPWNPPRGDLPPLEEGLLLELRGSALQPLLQGLVSRELIRAPLSERYGLDRQRLERLERAPFRLRLRPLQQGPFLAGMDLQLALDGRQADWQPVLDRISDSLAEQGLKVPGSPTANGNATAPGNGNGNAEAFGASSPLVPGPRNTAEPATSAPSSPPSSTASPSSPAATASPPANPPSQSPPSSASPATPQGVSQRRQAAAPKDLSLWMRPNGDVLGGWRWLPSRTGSSELVLFLGASPPPPQALPPLGARPGTTLTQLRLRPSQLALRGLLPDLLPAPVQQSVQLQVQAGGRQGKGSEASFSQLTGQLQVGPR
ncbi:MAG: hypothetical protein ACK5N0_05105 [Synechococcaceae cyanobacterium]